MSDTFDPYFQWLNIPTQQQPPDHYQLLGIQRFESNQQVIQAAADERMRRLRSYQLGPQSQQCQRLLTEVSQATACLMSPADKTEYDRKLRELLEQQSSAAGEKNSTAPDPPQVPAVGESVHSSVQISAVRAAKTRGIETRWLVMGGLVVATVGILVILGGVLSHLSKPSEHVEQTSPDDTNHNQVPASKGSDQQDPIRQPRPVNSNDDPVNRSQEEKTTGNTPQQHGPTDSRLPVPQRRDFLRQASLLQREIGRVADLTNSEKQSWAAKFVERAQDRNEPPARRYAHLDLAIKWATASQSIDLLYQSVDQMGSIFQVDSLEIKVKRLLEILNATEGNTRLAHRWVHLDRLMNHLIELRRFDLAQQIDAWFKEDGRLPVSGLTRTWQIQDHKQLIDQHQKMAEVLKTKSGDPQANEAVGIFLLLVQNDVTAALPHLSQASTETLRQLAAQEPSRLAESDPDSDQLAQWADQWWNAADTEARWAIKQVYTRRALYWDWRALQAGTDLATRLKIEPRIAVARGDRVRDQFPCSIGIVPFYPNEFDQRKDLIATVKAESLSRSAGWRQTSYGLEAVAAEPSSEFRLPIDLKEEWDLYLDFICTAGTGTLTVELPLEDRVVPVVFGGAHHEVSLRTTSQLVAGGGEFRGQFSSQSRMGVLIQLRRIDDQFMVRVSQRGKTMLRWIGALTAFNRRTSDQPTSVRLPRSAAQIRLVNHQADIKIYALQYGVPSPLDASEVSGDEVTIQSAPSTRFTQPTFVLATSPRTPRMLISNQDGGLSMRNTSTSKHWPMNVPEQLGAVRHAIFSANGRQLAIGRTGSVEIWNVGKNQLQWGDRQGLVFGKLVFDRQGKHLLANTANGLFRWKVSNGQREQLLDPEVSQQIQRFGYCQPRKLLVTTRSSDQDLQVWNLSTKQPAYRIEAGMKVSDLAVSADGRWLIIGSESGKLGVWDFEQKAFRFVRYGHTEPVNQLQFLPGQPRVVVSAGDDHRIRFWDLGTGRQLHRIVMRPDDKVYPVSFSWMRQGKTLLVPHEEGKTECWDLEIKRIAAGDSPEPANGTE